MHSALVDRWLARKGSSSPAVRDAAGIHAYREVVAASLAIAKDLRDGRASLDGERVAVLVSPGASFVASVMGVLLAGGTGVVLTPLYPERERHYFCEDARVHTFVVSPDMKDLADPHAEGKRVLYTNASRAEADVTDMPRSTARTAALQLYTSGTTGKPKGAVLTHENLSTQQRAVGEAWGFTEEDVLLHTLPLHHMHGLAIALFTALGAGACTRFVPFEAKNVWDSMGEATVFMGVPSMYQRLAVAYEGADADTKERWSANARGLRLATSGSAALPTTLGELFRRISGAYPLERFGMTEIGVGLTNPLAGERRPGSVGFPLASVETRVVDEHGNDAATGELLVRGPSVFDGYFERPEETKKAFLEDSAGGRPWFRTGDTVTRDTSDAGLEGESARGPFRVLGRTSVDILKSGGYKLSALEIEEVLREHPSVLDAAVVGLPDEAWGDRVVACVVVREGYGTPSEEDIRAFCKERLAPYKVPKDVHVRATLPRNPLGKVVKPDLVRELLARSKS
jgi:malonyl-CoA/methylmalonyl-CoA synthetase